MGSVFTENINKEGNRRDAAGGTAGVEQHIAEHARSSGDEILVHLVGDGVQRADDERDGGGLFRGQSVGGDGGRDEQTEHSENAEMRGFADEVGEGFDFHVLIGVGEGEKVAVEGFEDGADETAGRFGGFDGVLHREREDQRHPEDDGDP